MYDIYSSPMNFAFWTSEDACSAMLIKQQTKVGQASRFTIRKTTRVYSIGTLSLLFDFFIIPAKVGIHCYFFLDSRLRGNDNVWGEFLHVWKWQRVEWILTYVEMTCVLWIPACTGITLPLLSSSRTRASIYLSN